MSVLADRVAGQPGFDQAIEQFATTGQIGKLSACVTVSMIELILELEEELERAKQEVGNGSA